MADSIQLSVQETVVYCNPRSDECYEFERTRPFACAADLEFGSASDAKQCADRLNEIAGTARYSVSANGLFFVDYTLADSQAPQVPVVKPEPVSFGTIVYNRPMK